MFNFLKSLFRRPIKINGVKVEFLQKGHIIKSKSKKRADAIDRYIREERLNEKTL